MVELMKELLFAVDNKTMEVDLLLEEWEREGLLRPWDMDEFLTEREAPMPPAAARHRIEPMPPVSPHEIEQIENWGLF